MKNKKPPKPKPKNTIPAWECPKCGRTHPITVQTCECGPIDWRREHPEVSPFTPSETVPRRRIDPMYPDTYPPYPWDKPRWMENGPYCGGGGQ